MKETTRQSLLKITKSCTEKAFRQLHGSEGELLAAAERAAQLKAAHEEVAVQCAETHPSRTAEGAMLDIAQLQYLVEQGRQAELDKLAARDAFQAAESAVLSLEQDVAEYRQKAAEAKSKELGTEKRVSMLRMQERAESIDREEEEGLELHLAGSRLSSILKEGR